MLSSFYLHLDFVLIKVQLLNTQRNDGTCVNLNVSWGVYPIVLLKYKHIAGFLLYDFTVIELTCEELFYSTSLLFHEAV